MSLIRMRLLLAIVGMIAANNLPTASAQLAAPHDLKFIADQPVIALWASPEQHLKNSAAAELFKAILKTGPEGERDLVGAAVPKIDSFKMSMTPGKRSYSDIEQPIPVIVMHMSDAAAAKTMFEMMTKRYKPRTVSELSVPVYQYEFSQHKDPEGKTEEDKWILRDGTAQLDPQTVSTAMTAEKLIAVASAKEPATAGAWGADFKSLASAQSLLLIDTAKLRPMLEIELKRRPPRGSEALFVNALKPLYEESDYALLTLDTTDGIKLFGLAKSATPEAAIRFKGTLEGTVAMGKGMLPMLRPLLLQLNLPAESIDKVSKEVETAVNSLSITQEGTTTKLSLHIKQACVNDVVAGICVPLLEERQRVVLERRERWKREEAKMKEKLKEIEKAPAP